MTSNLRAAERFLANTLKLGPAMKVAFPVVGGIALLGVIGELGKKVYDFFHTLEEAPNKMRAAFHEADQSIELTNDSLRVSIAQLENANAKLKGQPENGLKLAIAQAREEADRLGESLDRDLKKVFDIEKENGGNWFSDAWKRMSGDAGTRDIAKELGGDEGNSGFRKMLWGKSPEELAAVYKSEIAQFQAQVGAAQNWMTRRNANDMSLAPVRGFGGDFVSGDMTKRIDALEEAIHNLQLESDEINLTQKQHDAQAENDKLKAAKANADANAPYNNLISEQNAKLQALKAEQDAIGKSGADQIAAKGAATAATEIARLNDEFRKNGKSVSEAQRALIIWNDTLIASGEAQNEAKKKFSDFNQELDARIERQKELNALEGSSYGARRDAETEDRLKKQFGPLYSDPNYARQIGAARTKLNTEADLVQAGKEAEANRQLEIQIGLQTRLAQVAGDFAATHQAELDAEIAKMRIQGNVTEEQLENVRKLDAAKLAAESRDRLANINQNIAASQRLTGAAFGGADAVRQADLENRIAEARAKGATAEEIAAMRVEEQARYNEQIISDAAKLVTADNDRLEVLNKEIEALKQQLALNGQNLQIETALKQLESERAKVTSDQALQQGTLQSGWDAFLLKMQEQAKTAGAILYDALNQAVDDTSKNLADMLTGNKPKGEKWSQVWGKEFKDIGGTMVQSSIKSMLQQGIGKLGAHFGVTPQSKMRQDLNDKTDPIHVYVTNQQGQQQGGNAVPNPLGGILKGGALGGLFGGGSQGGGIFSLLGGGSGGGVPSVSSAISFGGEAGGGAASMGGMSSLLGGGADASMGGMSALGDFAGAFADGGDVSSGWAIVGERGPEAAYFGRNGGHVVPNHMLNGGGDTYHIDARGADLGAGNRVDQAMKAYANQSVKKSMKSSNERAKRTVQRRGK